MKSPPSSLSPSSGEGGNIVQGLGVVFLQGLEVVVQGFGVVAWLVENDLVVDWVVAELVENGLVDVEETVMLLVVVGFLDGEADWGLLFVEAVIHE